jgi:fructosamine-3-kinase
MISPAVQPSIKHSLQVFLNTSVVNATFQPVGGGSINETYKIATNDLHFFCKKNNAQKFPQLFDKEKRGLALIAKQNIIKTPAVIDCFEENGEQILLLEWIESGTKTNSFWKDFGEQLAALHHCTSNKFGLEEDNYMGSVIQFNKPSSSWTDFFVHQRLQPLVKECCDKNLLQSKHVIHFENLYAKLSSIFNEEKPSLLHGDLWSGNFMCNAQSQPVLIDPAVYYGHRSMDLAMTTLFGGFGERFYQSYHYHFPLPNNYKEQWQVGNLYPLLIHLLLFGNNYLEQIENTLDRFS